MDDRRTYVIYLEQKFRGGTLCSSYTKFCTFEELLEEAEALYKDLCAINVKYHVITEAE